MVNVKAINDERLGRWKNKLIRHNSTPVILIGIGHDHKEGQLLILCTEERTDEELITLLEGTLAQLKGQ